MSLPFNITNPGIYIAGLLTSIEQQFVTDLNNLSYASGDILYHDGTNLTNLAAGTNGFVLTLAGGVPTWASGSAASSPLTTKGDLYGYSTTDARVPVGTNGQVLIADSTQALGVKWGAAGVGDMILASVQSVTGAKTFDSGKLIYAGATSGTTTLNASAVAGTTVLTLPAATDTLVGRATADTFINKSGNISMWTNNSGYRTAGNTLDQAYDEGGLGSGRTITADSGAIEVTVPDTSNNVGVAIRQNDTTNKPLALEVGATASKVSTSTVLQVNNDALVGQSDIAINSADSVNPSISMQTTGGTLATPLVTTVGTVSSIDTYIYNSTPAQVKVSQVYTTITDNTAGSEDSAIYYDVITAGNNITALSIGNGINGITIGDGVNTAILESSGNNDVTIKTGNATTGSITIANGANGDVTIAPNGTGKTNIGTVGTGVWNGTAIAVANGGTGAATASAARTNLGAGTMSNLVEDTTPQAGGNFDLNGNPAGDATEFDNGNSGTSKTIVWDNGSYQKITMTGNATLTFTAPTLKGRYQMRFIQDATGSRVATFPTILTAGGTGVTLSTAAGSIDIVTFYYDGTSYYAVDSLAFA